MTRVAVVGGGITGLTAAHELLRASPHTEVVVLEATARLGGKLVEGPVGPLTVDAGADGFLARQPEMAELCEQLGLGDDLVSPAARQAFIWARDDLRPIPAPSVLGVPLDADALARSGIVTSEGVDRFVELIDAKQAPLDGDATVGAALRPRVGDEVFEWLIDPLLGGINAGSGDEMSIEAVAPVLADAVREGGALRSTLTRRSSGAAAAAGPVFLGVKGGTGRIVDALAAELGDRCRLGCGVDSVEREAGAWRIESHEGPLRAEAVIVTTPAPAAASLVAPHAPFAASTLGSIDAADAVLVTFVYDRDQIERPLDGSGFLVPRSTGLVMTACSWASSKWRHYDDGVHAVMRVSAGRTDDGRWLAMSHDELVARLGSELDLTVGISGDPVAVRVTEWRRSLAQYRPGHLDRIAAAESELADVAAGLLVTGAACRGVGLPACVRQGRAAARAALAHIG